MVIFHADRFTKNYNTMYVKPMYENLDILWPNKHEGGIIEVNVMGFAGEMKV